MMSSTNTPYVLYVYRAEWSSASLCNVNERKAMCAHIVGPRGCQHVQTGATLLRLVYIPETNNRKLAGISLSSLCRCSSFTPEVFSEMILNLQHKPKVERK